MTSPEVMATVVAYLKEHDWKVKVDNEKQVITGGVNLNSKLSSANLGITFNPNGYTVYAISALKASKDDLTETAKYLHDLNYGRRNGNFELDFRDGEVRYKVYVNVKGLDSLPEEIVRDSIMIPFVEMDHYGDNLAGVLLGFFDADTAAQRDKKK